MATAKRDQNEKRRLPNRQKRDHMEWMQTARFIEEVERIELEGRVGKGRRAELEEKLLLPYNGVSAMRAGKFRVPGSAIELLKREYNGDFQYVLLGVRDEEKSSWLRAGRDLRVGVSYAHPYRDEPADLRALAGLSVLPRPTDGGEPAEHKKTATP